MILTFNWLCPVNVGSSVCADDEYLIKDRKTKLQALLDISAFYGSMYKVTVVGSDGDIRHDNLAMGFLKRSLRILIVSSKIAGN